jgi:hypothetical protein
MMLEVSFVGEDHFRHIFSVKTTNFLPNPGTKLAPSKKTLVKTTGIFSWQMLYPNLILDTSQIHMLCIYY